MGMYTGLRVFAYIKPEYTMMVEQIISRDREWSDFEYSFLEKFKKCSRASFIPFGAMSYIDWEQENNYCEDSGLWRFACSLKNYENVIENFLSEVLPSIAVSAVAEKLYEEESVRALYIVYNGELVKTRECEWQDE